MIRHEGSKYNVYDSEGSKRLGSHGTRKEAESQVAAIEASKARREKGEPDRPSDRPGPSRGKHGSHKKMWMPHGK